MLISLSFLTILSGLHLALFFKASPNGEYWNLTFSGTFGLYPKSSPVKYSYFSNSPLDNADILAASLSKSYSALFALILSSRKRRYMKQLLK